MKISEQLSFNYFFFKINLLQPDLTAYRIYTKIFHRANCPWDSTQTRYLTNVHTWLLKMGLPVYCTYHCNFTNPR